MDIANARLTFKSGCVANLTASRISPAGMRKIRVFQKDNYLSFDLKAQKVDRYALVDESFEDKSLEGFATSFGYWETGKKIIYHQPQSSSYDMLEEELRRFIDAVANDTTPPVSGAEREGLGINLLASGKGSRLDDQDPGILLLDMIGIVAIGLEADRPDPDPAGNYRGG